MSLGTWGWLVLAFPLAGSIVCALLYRTPNTKLDRLSSAASAIFLSFLSGIGALLKLQDLPEEHRARSSSNAFALRAERRASTSTSASCSTRCRSSWCSW